MDHEKLMEYLTQFSSDRRDEIFQEYVGGKHLKKTLATKEGKALLGSTINTLTHDSLEMVLFCCHKKMNAKNMEALKQRAFELNANFSLLAKWANAINTSDKLIEEVENTRK